MRIVLNLYLLISFFFSSIGIVSQDISSLSFYSLDGVRTTIKKENDNQKKLFLINFAKTNCNPCRTEIPELLSLETKIQNENFIVWIVFVEDDNDKIKQMSDELNIINKVPIYHDVMGISKKKLKIHGFPHTLLVKNNQIVYTSIGYTNTSISTTEKKILELLSSN